MSGFGSSGFGGFGQTNNNQTSSGFGFGSSSNTNNNTAGFGANTNNAFGSNANNTGGLFGSNNNNTSSTGGFGSTTGAFGSSSNNTFGGGNKTTFGGSSGGGGLFGNSNTNAGSSTFGGFGNTASNNTSSPFGASSSLFGSKPAFGSTSTNTGTTSLFGNNANTGTFGGSSGGTFGSTNTPGLGAAIGDPPGTNLAAFQAHVEKEANSTNQSNSFQNILFQDAYKKWSAEELRLQDYVQGRKHGNASGAGAFGVSSGFGGGFGTSNNQPTTFGNTSTGTSLFGGAANNNTTSTFGQTGSGAFGSNTGTGGLFGNKPATGGGLFGNTAQPAQSGGGLFGSNTGGFGNNANTGSAFGTNTTNAGGGLFGGASAATQNKPAGGFSFGQAGTNTSFGNTAATGGAFGTANPTANTGGGLFGNTGQNTTGGLFGGANNQQTNNGGFGTGAFGSANQQTGSSLFGNSQQKPANPFATANTGGGLFGNTQANTTPFGGAAATGATGGLFGAKPAQPAGGLFGATGTGQAAGTTGGLFGGMGANAQTQQPAQTGGLFSGMGQTQQKPSIFGSSAQPAGGSIFGSQNAPAQASLFGAQTAQQQPQSSLFGGSILGGSQGVGQAQQSLTASIGDVSAYGTPSLFANLGGNENANPGPLATPLGGQSKPRRSSILPMYKLNPASASRYMTPQKRGFGFSYSTYGTPGSPSSVSSTPGGLGRSLLSASTSGRSLSKSVSTSSLRRSFNTEDSILAPGAFSASSGSRFYGSNGSVKKLVINRDLRSDLFSTPTKDKPALEPTNGSRKLSKRVSFDTSTVDSIETNGDDGASAPATTELPELPSSGSRTANGAKPAISGPALDADASKGKELAIVHEEETSSQSLHGPSDKLPGNYWMEPSRAELDAMSRARLQSVDGFTVGRENVGSVSFKIPVDLTNIKLDELFGGIVNLQTRAATVYPDPSKKPPVGKGLNVPAKISLQESWPRVRGRESSRDPKRLAKHIERLKRIENTTFESYDKDTGVWTFSVEHFTTYGLEYDEDETDAEQLTAAEDDATPPVQHKHANDDLSDQSNPDDTFEFRRRSNILPGTFDPESVVDDRDDDPEMMEVMQNNTALSRGSKMTSFATAFDDSEEDMGAPDDETAEGGMVNDSLSAHEERLDDDASESQEIPGGILRARTRALKGLEAPSTFNLGSQTPWRESIKESLDTRHAAIRDEYGAFADGTHGVAVASDARGFSTSMDLMNSIFGKEVESDQSQHTAVPPIGGYTKISLDQAKPDDGGEDSDRPMRPTWGPNGAVLFATNAGAAPRQTSHPDLLSIQRGAIQSNRRDVRFGRLTSESLGESLQNQIQSTDVTIEDGIPSVRLRQVSMESLSHGRDSKDPASIHERRVWQLAGILFDPIEVPAGQTEAGIRKARLSTFWEDLVSHATSRAIALAKTNEEKALASLAGHRKAEACKHLLDGKNYRTATLVALIGSSEESKRGMRAQLKQWRENNDLSEFSEPMRAIYELLGGVVCVSEGKKDVPVEDRMDSFVISKHFGLDWQQSFGLRLWYGAAIHDDIAVAVKMLAEDIEQDKESRPVPWYAEQHIQPLWEDQRQTEREDLLWGLLKLYADKRTDLESILLPENSQLSPLDFRLSWQLSQALLSTGNMPISKPLSGKMDALTLSFASQLMSERRQFDAAWVLLHLADRDGRVRALREYLSRTWSEAAPSDVPAALSLGASFKQLGIPKLWVHEAIALWCRDRAEQTADFDSRLRFKIDEAFVLWQDERTRRDAHLIFARDVAPSYVVKRAYQELVSLATWVKQMEVRERGGAEWMLGGGIYISFANVVESSQRGQHIQQSDVDILLAGLPVLNANPLFQGELCQAAITEMASVATRLASPSGRRRQERGSVLGRSDDLMMTADSCRIGATTFAGRAIV